MLTSLHVQRYSGWQDQWCRDIGAQWASGDVRPHFASHNCRDLRLTNPKPCGKVFEQRAGRAQFSHLRDLLCYQFGIRMPLAPRPAFGVCDRTMPFATGNAPLTRGVLAVVPLSAKKEVRWIDASGNVTAVTDKQPVGDCAIGQFIGYAMGKQRPAPPRYPAIAKPMRRSFPHPALVCSTPLYAIPEALLKGCVQGVELGKRGTRSATESVSAVSGLLEWLSAAFTLKNHTRLLCISV